MIIGEGTLELLEGTPTIGTHDPKAEAWFSGWGGSDTYEQEEDAAAAATVVVMLWLLASQGMDEVEKWEHVVVIAALFVEVVRAKLDSALWVAASEQRRERLEGGGAARPFEAAAAAARELLLLLVVEVEVEVWVLLVAEEEVEEELLLLLRKVEVIEAGLRGTR